MDSLSTWPADSIFKILMALSAAGLAGFFWWRAGTTLSIMELLWRIFGGHSQVRDPRLAAFIDQARDLERFRFVFGVQLESMADAHRFLDWRESHDIPISRIQLVRKWFDAGVPYFILPPSVGYVARSLLYLTLCAIGFIVSELMASQGSAYLVMKESGVRFVSDGTSIEQPFWHAGSERLECRSAQSELMGFSATEKKILCDSLADGSLKKAADAAVQAQRKVALLAAVLFFIAILYLLRNIMAATSARRLLKKVRKTSR